LIFLLFFSSSIKVDTICFDKTGTLTRGCTEVSDFFYFNNTDGDEEEENLILFPFYDDLDNSNQEASSSTSSSKKEKYGNTFEQKQEQDDELYHFFHSYLYPAVSSPLFTSQKEKRPKPRTESSFYDLYSILKYLLMTEIRSSHPLAKGITSYCKKMISVMENPVFLKEINSENPNFINSFPKEDELLFDIIPGQGVHMFTNLELPSATKEIHVLVGNSKLLSSHGVSIPNSIHDIAKGFTSSGKVAIYYSLNGVLKGILSVSDKVRPETTFILQELMNYRNINCYMVTGDSLSTALAIGSSIGLPKENILAGVKPEEKELFVAALQEKGHKVAFIGDGTNDSPALSRSHVGLTMAASGSDIAIEAGDILLYKNSLSTLLIALDLSHRTLRRIKLNYLWAFGYNICLIPIAAGILYPFYEFALQPMYAGAVMAISSVSIVVSSLTIALYVPQKLKVKPASHTHHHQHQHHKHDQSISNDDIKHSAGNSSKKKLSVDRKKDSFDLEMTASLHGQQQPLKEKEEEEQSRSTEEEYCHCPISNIDMLEEELGTSFLGDTPKKLEQLTRKLSRQLSQQIQYLEGKDTKKLSAYEILADYKKRHSSELVDSNTTDTATASTDNSFMKKQISSSSLQKRTSSLNKNEEKKSKNGHENVEEGLMPLDLELMGLPTTNTGGELNKSCANPGCGCHGKNCRCPPGYCKCGLRKRRN
jgi:soluble P-type ATPase